jgi:hypothetical protein
VRGVEASAKGSGEPGAGIGNDHSVLAHDPQSSGLGQY